MGVLGQDQFIRNNGAAPAVSRFSARGATLFAMMFLSLALIVLSRINHTFVARVRAQLVEMMLPALEVASAPALASQRLYRRVNDFMTMSGEFERLRRENEQLRHWAWRAKELERELKKYQALANGVENSEWKFATGRIVADGRGPFTRSAILNVGRKQGAKSGFPVVNGQGLVGQTIDLGANASRVLLLTDLNSRIPVLIGAAGMRAIVAGTNSNWPEVQFLPRGAVVRAGDEVFTSGHGGRFPPGLRIGTLEPAGTRDGNTGAQPGADATAGTDWQVRLHASPERLDFVSVLFFEGPRLEQRLSQTRRGRRPRAPNEDGIVPPARRPSRIATSGPLKR